jgi:hypothetical protein
MSEKSNVDVKLPPIDPEEKNIFKIDNAPFELALRIDGFSNEKEQIAFIKSVEKMVRFSPEYKLWVNYIIDTLGQNKCEFTGEIKGECPVEVHHHPICLYTIVKTVIDQKLKSKQSFCTFDIARDVIELHFQNKVGYVVMLSDLHAKYHNGFMQIPIEFVSGDYKHILHNYEIEKEEYSRILLLCSVHKDDIVQMWSQNNYPGLTNSKTEVKEIETNQQMLISDISISEEVNAKISDMMTMV